MALLSRLEVRNAVYGEEWDVRRQSQMCYADEAERFVNLIMGALDKFDSVVNWVQGDVRRAYVAGYIWNAINDLSGSMALLLSGYQVASGALMRQFMESIAMAMLVSDRLSIPNLDALRDYPVDNAVSKVSAKKVAARLGLDRQEWDKAKRFISFYSSLSHASVFALATGSNAFSTHSLCLGAMFDGDRDRQYRLEISERQGSARLIIQRIEWLLRSRNESDL